MSDRKASSAGWEDRPQHHVRGDHPVAREITLLARKGRHPAPHLLESINQSVLGSMYTKYKTPALVNLDFTTTFTPKLLLKDMELGMGAAKSFGVVMPTASVTRDSVLALSHQYPGDIDFSVLLLELARAAA